MADRPRRKVIKLGVREGGGPPPGYRWNVDILHRAHDEALGFLDEAQRQHIAQQVRELARQDDPTRSDTVDVKAIENFHEIRDRGGILRGLNVRVFYFVHKPTRTIVVIGVIHKENNGPTPIGDRVLMRDRMQRCLGALAGPTHSPKPED